MRQGVSHAGNDLIASATQLILPSGHFQNRGDLRQPKILPSAPGFA
jgi:hypothetical protein